MGRSYRELVAWRKAMKFVTEIYQATQHFPTEERYGLTNQLRRAAVSVPSNIAEGQASLSEHRSRLNGGDRNTALSSEGSAIPK